MHEDKPLLRQGTLIGDEKMPPVLGDCPAKGGITQVDAMDTLPLALYKANCPGMLLSAPVSGGKTTKKPPEPVLKTKSGFLVIFGPLAKVSAPSFR